MLRIIAMNAKKTITSGWAKVKGEGRLSDPARSKQDPYADIILRDKLNDYVDLLAWSRRAGLLTEAQLQALIREARRRAAEAASVLTRALALREAIYRI